MTKLRWKGRIELDEQEGGYASPRLFIGNTNITNAIWNYFGCGNNSALFENIEGEWELTLKRTKE